MFKAYYQLTKPGIIYGNALTAIAGFMLAAKTHVDIKLLLLMLIGLSLIIGGSCVFNNIADKNIDSGMERTKRRAIVTGKISKRSALIYGSVLLILGIIVLLLFTNHYSLIAALIGFVVYVFLYTPLKPKTVYATLIGSIAGATPPVVGYAAVTNRYDLAALLLFIILVVWQMPHFYAIAVRRMKDYQNSSVPVLPIKNGVKNTKIQILIYIIIFIITSHLLTAFHYTKYTYAIVMLLLGLWWLKLAGGGFKTADDTQWAKKVFLFSLIVITIFSITLCLTSILP